MLRPVLARRHDVLPAHPAASAWEAVIVLGLPVSFFLGRQIWRLVTGGGVALRPAFTDSRLLLTLGIELMLAAVLLTWLSRRGWRLLAQTGRPTLGDVARGIALWSALFIVGQVVRMGLYLIALNVLSATQAAPLSGALSWWTIGAALLINPVFEEVLFLGYAIPILERVGGLRLAVIVSVTLRVLVHWNQGAHALISVLPFALLFTAYFIRTRRVWPVVVGHIINNAFGLGAFVGGGS